jgi:hypothetical protein
VGARAAIHSCSTRRDVRPFISACRSTSCAEKSHVMKEHDDDIALVQRTVGSRAACGGETPYRIGTSSDGASRGVAGRVRHTALVSRRRLFVPVHPLRADAAFFGARRLQSGFLEFHHVVPYAAGGETSVENLELRCRSHNAYEAEKYFGPGPLFVRERSWTWGLVPERGSKASIVHMI